MVSRQQNRPHAVPMVPRRPSGLVRHLDPAHFEQLIASLDSSSGHGLRDRAMILFIARLGLRSGEVVGLRLEELDWRNGSVAVRAAQIGFPQLLQDFFARRLIAERGASTRTVVAYREAFELLLGFVEQRTGKPPSTLVLADLDAPVVLDFLDHLETERGNSARTRNARLAAIHSFMRYVAVRDPPRCRSPPGCWPSRPNASTGRAGLPLPRAGGRDPGPHPTATPGAGGATGSCWPPPTTPAPAFPNSPPCASVTCSWTGRQPGTYCTRQGPQATRHPAVEEHRHRTTQLADHDQLRAARTGVSQPGRRTDDPLPEYETGSTGPSPSPHSTASRCAVCTSPRTRCGTRPRCTCCSRAPISPSSPSGSMPLS
jgi:integrase family protein with SAM-like domain